MRKMKRKKLRDDIEIYDALYEFETAIGNYVVSMFDPKALEHYTNNYREQELRRKELYVMIDKLLEVKDE